MNILLSTLKRGVLVFVISFACRVVAGVVDAPEIVDDRLIAWPYSDEGIAVVPQGVKHIAEMAFASRQVVGVEMPESVESIGTLAFWHCDNLRDVRLPQSVKDIGDQVFAECCSLTNAVVLSKIKKTSTEMFSKCRQLRHVVLPEGLEGIGDYSFLGSRALREIRIPSSVTNIGRGAFSGCSRLKKFVFSGNLENVEKGAFDGCYDLQDLPRAYISDWAMTNVCHDRAGQQIGVLSGLAMALRIAADGFASNKSYDSVNVGLIDTFAAEAGRIGVGVDWNGTKGSVWNPTTCPGEKADEGSAGMKGSKCWVRFDFGQYNGDLVGLELEIVDEKISRITFSDALKEGVRVGLKTVGAVADEKVLRWLE